MGFVGYTCDKLGSESTLPTSLSLSDCVSVCVLTVSVCGTGWEGSIRSLSLSRWLAPDNMYGSKLRYSSCFYATFLPNRNKASICSPGFLLPCANIILCRIKKSIFRGSVMSPELASNLSGENVQSPNFSELPFKQEQFRMQSTLYIHTWC